MVKVQALPELAQETVVTAYQLLKFYSTGHQYAEQDITEDCLNSFQFIVAHYTDPSYHESLPRDSSTSRRGRSIGRDLSPDFPSNWSLDGGRFEIRRSQTNFLIATANLRSHPSFAEWLQSQGKIHLPSPNPTDTTTLDAERAVIAQTIANVVRDALISQAPKSRRQSPERSETENAPVPNQFKPEEIGFFDPELDQGLGDGDIISIGKELWMRNVFVFIQRIKDVTALKGSEVVRTNLPTCLRGAAQRWYSDELNDRDKITLSRWYTALAKRFRENPMVATRKLNEHPALLVAYGGLEAEMRRDIKMPTASTTKEEFIQQMEDQRYNWEEIFGRYQNSHKFNTSQDLGNRST
ncbi:hypothetical protein V8E54_008927 [Elaphomyces granulatus]